ncbi:hypothetical protein [Streptomyces sp. NPDC059783]|uniref:hypothetical protein n=1 Tax=Streptomyces sp. NPDC059783 TaxID=3346944 RepID=UPI0036622E9C
MPQPDPATVPVTLNLSPAAARALFTHDPCDTRLETVLRQIAAGSPPAGSPPVPHTAAVDPHLLQQARQAAIEHGITLDEAIEQTLLHEPVLLSPARIARLLGVEKSTLNRALANNDHAPAPVNPPGDGRPLYDVHAVLTWWPTRRREGRPRTPRAEAPPAAQ